MKGSWLALEWVMRVDLSSQLSLDSMCISACPNREAKSVRFMSVRYISVGYILCLSAHREIYYGESAYMFVGSEQPRPQSIEQVPRKEDHNQDGTPGT